MGLPTTQEIRQAFVTFGRLAAAGNYYAGFSSDGSLQLSDAEWQAATAALLTLSRSNFAGYELLGLATALPTTPIFTAPRQGVFLIMGYLTVTAAAATGTLSLALTWNDGQNTWVESQLTNFGMTTIGQADYMRPVVLAANQPVSMRVALNGVTGSPLYSVYNRIIEL